LTRLNHKKIFLRSPLVNAASKGRQDLVQTLVQTFGYKVDDIEELTGLNALGAAVHSGDKVLFELFVVNN